MWHIYTEYPLSLFGDCDGATNAPFTGTSECGAGNHCLPFTSAIREALPVDAINPSGGALNIERHAIRESSPRRQLSDSLPCVSR